MPPTRTKAPRKTISVASSSKHTLDNIPPLDLPETITPGYVYQARSEESRRLSDDERAKLTHELLGFNPRSLCKDITDTARDQIYTTLDAIEDWIRSISGDNPKYETELNTGLVALETLLESHVDKAFDKFEAWVTRNAFDFQPELEIVLPWQKGLDFQRGEYVTKQPKGQQMLDDNLEDLRSKVEQARLLSQKLELAEKKLDHRLAIAKQRKSEVGFIKEVIDSAGLNPLPKPTKQLLPILLSLQTSLQPLEPIQLGSSPTINPPTTKSSGGVGGEHTKAWELGRSAYLNWALGKVLPTSATSTEIQAQGQGQGQGQGDKLGEIENDIKQVIGEQQGSLEESTKVSGNL